MNSQVDDIFSSPTPMSEGSEVEVDSSQVATSPFAAAKLPFWQDATARIMSSREHNRDIIQGHCNNKEKCRGKQRRLRPVPYYNFACICRVFLMCHAACANWRVLKKTHKKKEDVEKYTSGAGSISPRLVFFLCVFFTSHSPLFFVQIRNFWNCIQYRMERASDR
jgi:hypothetical protein